MADRVCIQDTNRGSIEQGGSAVLAMVKSILPVFFLNSFNLVMIVGP